MCSDFQEKLYARTNDSEASTRACEVYANLYKHNPFAMPSKTTIKHSTKFYQQIEYAHRIEYTWSEEWLKEAKKQNTKISHQTDKRETRRRSTENNNNKPIPMKHNSFILFKYDSSSQAYTIHIDRHHTHGPKYINGINNRRKKNYINYWIEIEIALDFEPVWNIVWCAEMRYTIKLWNNANAQTMRLSNAHTHTHRASERYK